MQGRYLYCVTRGGASELGDVGIEKNKVYSIEFKDVAAVVHACEQEPYATTDDGKAREWVFTHQYVIDLCMKRFGTVLPFSFDVIVKGGDEEVRKWLEHDYSKLRANLERLDGKAQYGIQVFYDKKNFKPKIDENKEIIELNKKIDELERQGDRRPGMKYVLEKKIQKLSEEALMKELEDHKKALIDEIKKKAVDLVEEKSKDGMLLNVSCLLNNEQAEAVGKLLDEANKAFTVKFTGPWPAYSFVGDLH